MSGDGIRWNAGEREREKEEEETADRCGGKGEGGRARPDPWLAAPGVTVLEC